jgi:DNA-directed RNA polymerase subunit H (RpoH/RPB5)
MGANKQTKLYAKAKYEAVHQLITNHEEEYESMFKQIKIKYGIKPRLTNADKIARYKEAIAMLERGENHE